MLSLAEQLASQPAAPLNEAENLSWGKVHIEQREGFLRAEEGAGRDREELERESAREGKGRTLSGRLLQAGRQVS